MDLRSNLRDMGDRMSEQSSPESPFLAELFQTLNEAAIPYCVLRNYENLPHNLNGSDVDMLVREEQLDKACSLLRAVAGQFKGKCILVASSFRMQKFVFCGRYSSRWWGVRFDAIPFLGSRGYNMLSADTVLRRSYLHNGVRVANANDAAVVAFLKEVVCLGRDSRGYYKEASLAYAQERELYSRQFKNSLGSRTFEELLDPLFEGKRKDFRHQRKTLNGSVKWILFRRQPLASLAKTVTRWVKHLRRIWEPPGFSVAVLGTDGSGKSTIIEGISGPLERALHTRMLYEHLRPNLMPSLARLFGRPEPEGPVTNPHGTKPSNFGGSLLRITYYSLDYIFGYWFKVFPGLVKRPTIWVFDRYFYDYAMDPRRSRLSLPKWIVKLYSLFIPRPDIILCLGADAETIHARKPEISIEEVRRQVRHLKEFCVKEPRAFWIDTGCEEDESVDRALEAITSRMAARYGKRNSC